MRNPMIAVCQLASRPGGGPTDVSWAVHDGPERKTIEGGRPCT